MQHSEAKGKDAIEENEGLKFDNRGEQRKETNRTIEQSIE